MPRPIAADYPEYFGRYINLVTEEELIDAFTNQFPIIENLLRSIDEEKAGYAYAPAKWTLKELLQHCVDAERVFTYRALCFARKETISLPSFDENLYADNSNANARNWQNMGNEFINVRRATEDLFKSFSQDMLQQTGVANNNSTSVLSLGYIIVGHVTHHIKLIEERYLV